MTYEKIFSDVKKVFLKADVKTFTEDFAFQFNITGEGEGIFYAAYKNGKLAVEPYDYLDRDVIFTADGKTLVDIATGKTEPIEALKAGKFFVEGDHELAKQLMFLIASKKPAAKKPAAKKEAAKPAAKAAAKPAAKPASKTESKPAKPAAKTEAKTAKPAAPAAKSAAKPAAKAAETKPAAKAAEAKKPADLTVQKPVKK